MWVSVGVITGRSVTLLGNSLSDRALIELFSADSTVQGIGVAR